MIHIRLARTTCVLAVLLTLGPWGAVPAFAAPPRWPAGALIRVWIDPKDVPPDAGEMVTRAVKTWSGAAAGRIALQMTGVENRASVRVIFIRDPSRYGETAPHVDRAGTITSADVFINSLTAGDLLDRRIILYLTALHELGHALGLAHTDNFGDIMYAFRPGDGERYFGAFRRRVKGAADIGSATATGLSAADVAALRALYER